METPIRRRVQLCIRRASHPNWAGFQKNSSRSGASSNATPAGRSPLQRLPAHLRVANLFDHLPVKASSRRGLSTVVYKPQVYPRNRSEAQGEASN
jgi:hypothetical protein